MVGDTVCGGAQLADEYRKVVGTKVKDVMRPAPLPVDPETSLESVAQLLQHAGTGSLSVLADGRLVGMVSCVDLVEAVAETAEQVEASRTGDELVAEMETRLAREPWVFQPGHLDWAKNGVVMLFGMIDAEEEKSTLGLMTRTIPGRKGVGNNLFPKSLLPGRGHWL